MQLRLTHLLGGTIGMKVIRKAYEPVTNYLPEALRDMNIMHNVQFAQTMADIDTEKSFLYLPLSFPFALCLSGDDELFHLIHSRLANEESIAYYIKEYDPLLDSTNMTFDNYIHIALDIKVRVELPSIVLSFSSS